MVGEIISEWWATSNRNGGRDHSGIVGDIERNQQWRHELKGDDGKAHAWHHFLIANLADILPGMVSA
jgi:hypothetical protein